MNEALNIAKTYNGLRPYGALVDLLLEALLSEEPQARAAWTAWRAQLDIDALPYRSQQLLAALSPALPDWLEQDPAAARFTGVVRQAWSQNQVRLQTVVELDACLRRAGVRALVTGPPAWAIKAPRPAIRPIPHLNFLVPREQARWAREVLTQAGWEPTFDFPPDLWWDRRGHVCVQQGNLQVHLHWRLLPVPAEDARECERAFLSKTERIHWSQHTLETISPEATLLHILCCERTDGGLPWEADVALTGTAGMNWTSFLHLAQRFAPPAIARLCELHRYGRLAIPQLPLDNPGAVRSAVRYAWRRYRIRSYYRKQAPSWSGFAEFLVAAAARRVVRVVPVRLGRG